MSKRLIIQSISDAPNDRFTKYMELEQPIHEEWARRCGADYECFVGAKEVGLHPTWNRIPMFVDAFDACYDRVFWMDADVLVVDLDRNIFEEVPAAPLSMTRVPTSWVEMPWKESFDPAMRAAGLCATYKYGPDVDDVCLNMPDHFGVHENSDGPWERQMWDVYNDGVLLADNTAEARACFDFAWANRRAEFQPWHVPGMPELDWILDYVYDHPDHVALLDDAWNWQRPPTRREDAAILAYHGQPAQLRWDMFVAAYREFYG